MGTNDSTARHPAGIHHDPAEPAGTCLHAAIRLRWQAADLAGSTTAGIVRAMSELLDAVAVATAADAGSVPASVRRSAARLADQVYQAPLTLPNSSPDRVADGCSPGSLRRADAADSADADRLRLPE